MHSGHEDDSLLENLHFVESCVQPTKSQAPSRKFSTMLIIRQALPTNSGHLWAAYPSSYLHSNENLWRPHTVRGSLRSPCVPRGGWIPMPAVINAPPNASWHFQ